MDAPGAPLAARWHAAVTNLRLAVERVQATADELPPHVTLTEGRGLCPNPVGALQRHELALYDYTTALTCVRTLLREYDVGAA